VSGRSRQAYELAKLILTAKYVPIVGKGKARWNNVHVHDLSDVYALLVDAAIAGNHSSDIWGAKGYILAENGEHMWSEYAEEMGQQAHKLGYIDAPKQQSLGKEAALKQAGFEAVSWGLNSRGKAERAKRALGWKPHRPSIQEEIPNILQSERQRLSAQA